MQNEHAPIGAEEIAGKLRKVPAGEWYVDGRRIMFKQQWHHAVCEDEDAIVAFRSCRRLDEHGCDLIPGDGEPAHLQALVDVLNAVPDLLTLAERGLAAGAGETITPFCYVLPGDDTANDKGFIDAMAWQESEFTKPLYTAQDLATARASERERCAKIAEMRDEIGAQIWPDGHDIAAAIREDKKEGA